MCTHNVMTASPDDLLSRYPCRSPWPTSAQHCQPALRWGRGPHLRQSHDGITHDHTRTRRCCCARVCSSKRVFAQAVFYTQGGAVDGAREHRRVVVKDVLRAVPVMHVPVHHHHPPVRCCVLPCPLCPCCCAVVGCAPGSCLGRAHGYCQIIVPRMINTGGDSLIHGRFPHQYQ